MNQIYKANYHDEHGDEEILIHNNGQVLTTTIRGIEFSYTDIFYIRLKEPQIARQHPSFHTFMVDDEDLYSFTVDYEMPILVVQDSRTQNAALHVHLEMSAPDRLWNGQIQLRLSVGADSFQTRLINDDIEVALLDLESALPQNTYLKCCFFCNFSDYSPYGKNAYGDMACHRNNKQEYLAVQTKRDYFAVPVTETVQETYLCPEFEKRKKGTGYRG